MVDLHHGHGGGHRGEVRELRFGLLAGECEAGDQQGSEGEEATGQGGLSAAA
jgi:hypothetical protein